MFKASSSKWGKRFAFGAFCSIPIISFSLGIWQIKRLSWKKQLLKDLERCYNEKEIDSSIFSGNPMMINWKYNLINLSQNPSNEFALVGPKLYDRKKGFGYQILVPFEFVSKNNEKFQLVLDIGWIPQSISSNKLEIQNLIKHFLKEYEIKGYVSSICLASEKSNSTSNDNTFFKRDLSSLAQYFWKDCNMENKYLFQAFPTGKNCSFSRL